MKTISLEQTTLDACVHAAQYERVVVTRNGKPIALIVGVEGLDEEQLQLGSSANFWQLIEERRSQKTISRAQLEQNLNNK
jgi:antitoxin (DNA-binding transcriptional repressor) of toxin-antitoxin stability system